MMNHEAESLTGNMLISVCAAAAVFVGGTVQAHAQSLSLPNLDNVNFFFQAGSLIGSHDLVDDPSSNEKMFGELGWGFETSFDMLTSPTWDVELAVGYDQMFMRSEFIHRYTLRGTVKNLSSISIYASHANGLYAGLGTGAVSLSNVFAFADGHRAFSVAGDTFDLAGRLGVSKGLGETIGTNYPRANLFVEAAYHARFLGSVSYGTGAPDTLPGSLFFGGVVISVGVQVSLKPSAKPSSDEIKAEVKRLKGLVSPMPTEEVTTTTACADAQLKPNDVPIDDYWDPVHCGSPETVKANVWVLTHLPETKSKGPSSLEICAYMPTPKGWKDVSDRWDPTRCGRPSSVEKNVRLIRKE